MKTAEIITVGNELVRGQSIDTHSSYLSSELAPFGLRVRFQTTVGDVVEEIAEAVKTAWDRADLVVLTGGLGPTVDDLSREGLSQALGLELKEDASVWDAIQARFNKAGRTPTPNNRRQALVPQGATVIANENGTAPALKIEKDGKALFALPGPPAELKPLVEGALLPWLKGKQSQHVQTRRLRCYGLGESAVDEALQGLVKHPGHQDLAMLAHGGEVELILTATDAGEAKAKLHVEEMEAGVLERLGTRIFSLDGRSLEAVVVDLLKEAGNTVAVAESCTGGRVMSRLTAVPGASEVFEQGFVTYADSAKELLLDVPPFVLKRAGAVSKDCALAMAVGLARRVDSDYCVAITGIAGPGGGSEEKPVGTVHIAVAAPTGVRHQHYVFKGSERTGVQARATQAALWLLYCALADIDTDEEATDRGGYQKA
jgi:nicotinamide-nucleotide amidase